MSEENWLNVGKIVAPQGLKGEVRVNPSSDFPERFLKPGPRWLQKNKEKPNQVTLQKGRQIPGKSLYIVSFQEIINRDQAECIVGEQILVPLSERPSLGVNEFHLLDLIGLKVKLKNTNDEIGEITNLISYGNDLLEIDLIEGKKVLVPFVKEIIPIVNINKKFIVISPPKGLFEL